jgi:hypothetical protein
MPVELLTVVESLIAPFVGVSDTVMGQPWVFDEYDEEGLRFALLQTNQELRELAVLTHEARVITHPMTTAQRIMAQYHLAYRDMRGALSGVPVADFKREPAPGEWSIRRTLQHMITTPIYFLAVSRYALERQRTGDNRPANPPDDVLDSAAKALMARFGIGADEGDRDTLPDVLGRFDALHATVIHELGTVSNDELDWPSIWWEGSEKPIRFRLLRFEAHLRQHTVQIEKTRLMLGHQPTEANWLIRQTYNTLGEAESAALGIHLSGELQQMHSALIEKIRVRAAQIAALLQQ